ncbi:MAG: hypothetical protein K2Q18_01215, partial [Bdellovibrionales bacterium]|nr:hypothetical protein [Bdellovibrionales bacterium]
MKKINTGQCFFTVVLNLALASSGGYSSNLYAQTSEELFKRVFGKGSSEERTILIDATLGDFFIGEVAVTITGEKISKISSKDLKKILADKIREERLAS